MPILLYGGLNKKYKPGGLNRTLLWPGSWLMARVCAKKGGGHVLGPRSGGTTGAALGQGLGLS